MIVRIKEVLPPEVNPDKQRMDFKGTPFDPSFIRLAAEAGPDRYGKLQCWNGALEIWEDCEFVAHDEPDGE